MKFTFRIRSTQFRTLFSIVGRKMNEIPSPEFVCGKIPISGDELDLGTVLTCGQSFRWRKYDHEPNAWIGVHKNFLWILNHNQTDGFLNYKVYPPIIDTCTATQIISKYFQLDISLPKLYADWSESDPKFHSLTQTNDKLQRIRILWQEPVETIFSFICSSNNNIKRITSMIDKLCEFYGDEIIELHGVKYYAFPQVIKLQGDAVEAKLRKEGFGYRAKFISKSAEIIVNNGEDEWIEKLFKIGYEDARIELQGLHGVGRKVADCICLMAFGYHESVPVDTHIHQIAKTYLPNLGGKTKTLTHKNYTEIADYFRKIHGPYAGWAQSVLFSSRLSHLRKRKISDT